MISKIIPNKAKILFLIVHFFLTANLFAKEIETKIVESKTKDTELSNISISPVGGVLAQGFLLDPAADEFQFLFGTTSMQMNWKQDGKSTKLSPRYDVVSAAYGLNSNFFIGLNIANVDLKFNYGALEQTTSGLMEPQLGFGYRLKQNSQTYLFKLTHNLDTGSSISESTSKLNGDIITKNNSKKGGSAWMPSFEFQLRPDNYTLYGFRLSYYILGKQSYKTKFINIQSNSTIISNDTREITGGNSTNIEGYFETKLSANVDLGFNMGYSSSENTKSTEFRELEASTSTSTDAGSDYFYSNIELSVQINKNLNIIPQIGYSKPTTGVIGQVDVWSVGLFGLVSF